MVVLITAVDAAISPGSVAFAKMLKSSLEYRRIESMSLFALQSPVIVDYGSREAANSVFSQDMANEHVTYHIDIRSIDTEELGSPIASLDFIIAYAEYATDRNLNESVVETLSGFAEVKEKPLQHNNMYPSIFANLVLRVPTITIILNESSVDLYRAAADELAEIAEQTAHHRTD
jgi:hypothetical protein